MARKKTKSKYTRPELRAEIKEDLKASDKGGTPGQWSARKSQLLVREYEKRGGGYTSGTKDEAAKSLEKWTDQDWQTVDGEGDAREGGKTKRYLPKMVWQALSDEERREAERTKTTKSKAGKQYVPWTPAIKRAFEEVEQGGSASDSKSGSPGSGSPMTRDELYDRAKQLGVSGRSRMTKVQLRRAIETAR
ncbi:hypothetical protein [Tautonia plasticadhaerens]|uniref:DUF5872 domain-containing protein n=1 Tax=Tautonia plasticadhaerens TaxID=2527974 RepID=A0A518HCW1_9BACT|nr:hypothetical protein [Tautonia plasticadhaerens]QDV38506.1 hypothetical protein ElP_64610 [Tautonia plasticadhaerens]